LIQPTSLDDLREGLAGAHVRGAKAGNIDLARLNRVVAHAPDDMTVTVEAGITLAGLQSELSGRGQWLPIDPPNPDRLTIGALIATNASGPRRLGCGTIRDYLIGLRVVLADGRLIKSGGQVVKNVAGYDLAKLFVGSYGSLGIIVEATFKLRPLPEAEQFVQARANTWDQAGALIESVLESEITPVTLDLHNLAPPEWLHSSAVVAVLGFAGTREEIDWQLALANKLGWNERATLDYERCFWDREPRPHRTSVLPSRVVETIGSLGDVPVVARAGNGVIYYRGGPRPAPQELPIKLMRRVKDAFDPKHVLADLPL
jgi:FAD/FMN-containing dehydrogenase